MTSEKRHRLAAPAAMTDGGKAAARQDADSSQLTVNGLLRA